MLLLENVLKFMLARTGLLARSLPLKVRKKLVADFVPPDQYGEIRLDNGAVVKYPLNDHYWVSLAWDIRGYESEVRYVANQVLDQNTLFIDAGANIGLWSCYAAAIINNPAQVIAVEPGQNALNILRCNQALSGRKFTVLEKAVWSESDCTLEFALCEQPVSNYLVNCGGYSSQTTKPRIVAVQTICIDEIAHKAIINSPNISRVIIKLDIEGAEIAAIIGAAQTLAAQDVLIIFEDHRKDKTCKITDQILNELGLHVYYINPETFACKQIIESREVLPFKTNLLHSCNFVACRPNSKFDIELQKMCAEIAKDTTAPGTNWVNRKMDRSCPAKDNARRA